MSNGIRILSFSDFCWLMEFKFPIANRWIQICLSKPNDSNWIYRYWRVRKCSNYGDCWLLHWFHDCHLLILFFLQVTYTNQFQMDLRLHWQMPFNNWIVTYSEFGRADVNYWNLTSVFNWKAMVVSV